MNITIIGCNGQLGYDMVSLCEADGNRVYGIDYPDIDITDRISTEIALKKSLPELIINCAAYTAVDDCERNQKEAIAVNAGGVANIAEVAKSLSIPMVQISTDYVFDGHKKSPYLESDKPNPQSVYGKSKLEGEKRLCAITEKHFLFRIAWLYGSHGKNFVKTIHSLGKEMHQKKRPLKVVNDQFGTPTYTKDICRQILKAFQTGIYGTYHCTSEGECSWYDFACYILNSFNIATEVIPCSTEEFPRPAQRPPYGVLENMHLKSLNINIMPHWQKAFDAFVSEVSSNDS